MAAPPAIDGYTGLVPIGRGGLGDVYRAVQSATGVDVAIKVLRDVSDTSLAWHRTRRELAALLALSGHANVVQIVEVLDLPSGPALVMEHAPGGSVADLLQRRGGTLTVGETVFVGRQTAAALVSAHARGIVHRDIKPQNLLVDADGQVQLCDFGIAALTRDEQYRSRTNAVSMRYASPEDLEHESDDDDAVGPASDVYSLGATLLHLAHGNPPTLKERLAPWSPPTTDDASLAALDRVLAWCLHPTPAMRPTAQALSDALEGLALGAGLARVTALDTGAAPVPTLTAELAVRAPVPEPIAAIDPVDVEDDTVVPERTAATASFRPDPPRPIPTGPRWHRPVTIAAALVALAAIAAAAVTLWPAGDDAPSADPVPVTVPRPDDLPPLVDAAWPAGAVGECLVQVAGEDVLGVVPCDEPHDLQRFHTGEIPDAAFDPGAVAATVDAECAARFEAFVGSDPAISVLRIAQTRPNADTWAIGDRTFACFVGLDTARLTADARNSAW